MLILIIFLLRLVDLSGFHAQPPDWYRRRFGLGNHFNGPLVGTTGHAEVRPPYTNNIWESVEPWPVLFVNSISLLKTLSDCSFWCSIFELNSCNISFDGSFIKFFDSSNLILIFLNFFEGFQNDVFSLVKNQTEFWLANKRTLFWKQSSLSSFICNRYLLLVSGRNFITSANRRPASVESRIFWFIWLTRSANSPISSVLSNWRSFVNFWSFTRGLQIEFQPQISRNANFFAFLKVK